MTLASPEVHFQLDNERADPLSMDAYKLKDTNSLVEEFMLMGNCLVARRITDAYPKLAILRRHPVPDKYLSGPFGQLGPDSRISSAWRNTPAYAFSRHFT